MKKIKNFLYFLVAFGALSPLLKINAKNIIGYNFYINLTTLGLLSSIAGLIIFILALHSFYLNDKLENISAIYLDVLNLIFTFCLFSYMLLKLRSISSNSPLLGSLNQYISISWGWLLISIPLVINIVINIIIKRKNNSIDEQISELEKEDKNINQEILEDKKTQ